MRLTKIHAASPQPQIIEVKDSVTGKVDEALTSSPAKCSIRKNRRFLRIIFRKS